MSGCFDAHYCIPVAEADAYALQFLMVGLVVGAIAGSVAMAIVDWWRHRMHEKWRRGA